MAVIWGLDLKEMQWWKFKGSYMFNQTYHLRKTKMIVYQMAMILCVVSESVGTASLSDYVDEQDGIQTRNGRMAHVQNNDIVGILSYNIFVGIAVATIFGSGFFFDLFWPERRESPSVKLAWKICSVLMCFFTLSDAVALTVIVATKRAHIDGVSRGEEDLYFRTNGKPNPVYRHNPYNITATVILWPGFVATCGSTYVMWKSLQHNDIFGPFSAKHGNRGVEAAAEKPGPATQSTTVPAATGTHETTPASPRAPPHCPQESTPQPYAGT